MVAEQKTNECFQVALDIGFDASKDIKRYREAYSKVYDSCFVAGKTISSSIVIKREEYAPSRHIAFLVGVRTDAEEVVRKAKESGLVTAAHIDSF